MSVPAPALTSHQLKQPARGLREDSSRNGDSDQRRSHLGKEDVLGRPCRRNQFLDRISNPILGSSTRASFAGRQQVASGFSQTRIAMMAETAEMVGASFLSICVTVGAASFGPPKARNLLSSALPFNVVAPLFFWWVWRQLAAHPTSEPTPMAQQRNPPGAHLEPTLHCMGEREEPTQSPPGTHREPKQEPAWQSERNPRGAYESPPGTHREPTPNRSSAGAHLPPTGVYNTFYLGEKGMRWETSRPLLVLYNGCSSKGTGNSRKTFETESRTQVGDRAGSLVGLLEL